MPLNNFHEKINSRDHSEPPSPLGRFKQRRRIAAPSAVWPEALPGNCKKLAALPGRPVDEIGLCLFEAKACLEYGPADLPDWLAGLGLGFHVHLPLDLPWSQGFAEIAAIIRGLARKTAFLWPRAFVLHPPPAGHAGLLTETAALFRDLGIPPSRVLLENVEGDDLARHAAVIESAGFSVCLDLGHMLAFGQRQILDDPRLTSRVAMVHAYAPGPRGEHRSLARLDDEGRDVLRRALALLPQDGALVVECFRPDDLLESLDALPAMIDMSRMEDRA